MRKHKLATSVGLIVALLFGGVVLYTANGLNSAQQPLNSSQKQVVRTLSASDVDLGELNTLVNQERIKNGLPALRLNADLRDSAAAKCRDMVAYNYYDHISPSGTRWDSFIAKRTNYQLASENLDSRTVEATAAEINQDWMNSKGHRDNILFSKFTDVGYASCMGTYKKQPTLFVVQHFIEKTRTTTTPNPPATRNSTTFCSSTPWPYGGAVSTVCSTR